MATTKKAPTAAAAKPKKAAPKGSKFDIDFESFTNNAEWELYTVSTYVRAKQVPEKAVVNGKLQANAGDYVVVSEDHKVSVVPAEKFEAEYEQVKGPHKRAF